VNDPSTGDISGVITDRLTGLPIANVIINLPEHETAYTTDVDGYYLIDEIEAGPYTVSCHASGYDVPEQVTIKLSAGESVIIDFSLVPTANPINN